MATSEPDQPRYQIRVRSLFFWTIFVAVVCSIGVRTHWLVSAAIALPVVIGGITGWIVAGTGEGFVQGVVVGFLFLLGDFLVCCAFLSAVPHVAAVTLQRFAVLHVSAVLIGGILGGLLERFRR